MTARTTGLYLALLFQVLALLVSFFSDYTRASSVMAGCAACTAGLLIAELRQRRSATNK